MGALKGEKDAMVRPGQQVRYEGQGWCFVSWGRWEVVDWGAASGTMGLFVKDSNILAAYGKQKEMVKGFFRGEEDSGKRKSKTIPTKADLLLSTTVRG